MEDVLANYGIDSLDDIDKTSDNYLAFVQEVVALLKSTYVSTASNETVYEYVYDTLYSDYVGSGTSTGSYFLALEYQWLSEYYESGDIEFLNKLSYDELVDLLS